MCACACVACCSLRRLQIEQQQQIRNEEHFKAHTYVSNAHAPYPNYTWNMSNAPFPASLQTPLQELLLPSPPTQPSFPVARMLSLSPPALSPSIPVNVANKPEDIVYAKVSDPSSAAVPACALCTCSFRILEISLSLLPVISPGQGLAITTYHVLLHVCPEQSIARRCHCRIFYQKGMLE